MLFNDEYFAYHVLMWAHIQNKIELVDKISVIDVDNARSVTGVSAWD